MLLIQAIVAHHPPEHAEQLLLQGANPGRGWSHGCAWRPTARAGSPLAGTASFHSRVVAPGDKPAARPDR